MQREFFMTAPDNRHKPDRESLERNIYTTFAKSVSYVTCSRHTRTSRLFLYSYLSLRKERAPTREESKNLYQNTLKFSENLLWQKFSFEKNALLLFADFSRPLRIKNGLCETVAIAEKRMKYRLQSRSKLQKQALLLLEL
ncbi:hypothetical protein AVEN_211839-1 [Araneus ventricosus]|uniref:Uncharacterized protein n=1 Tax=Araneus ventricosus TaxID=182803 RepID=A0A4Y2HI30_ARAVE|nr:hypothetical protein AVEN_211839-1 [Araneus ventricosus]